MQLYPYLTFDGTCADALTFYAKALDGTVDALMRFGEMPPQDWVTEANRDRVAHGRVVFAGGTIMASDTAGSQAHPGFGGFSLNVSLPDPDKAKALFEMLAEGGEITMDFAPTFWAKGFGTCRDRFGVGWMINCE